MTKLLVITLALAAGFSTAPAFADTNGGSTIGRGCTLDPFEHVMRCIDFDHCTVDKDGKKTCPVTTTPTRKISAFAIMH